MPSPIHPVEAPRMADTATEILTWITTLASLSPAFLGQGAYR